MKKEHHGMVGTPTYTSWIAMKQRCLNKKHPAYHKYGELGITICDRWKDSFVNFYTDMGARPEGKTLDRIDGFEGYYKENCRWATATEQMNNLRKSYLFYKGEKIHYKDLCKKYNIRENLFHNRVQRGWTIDQAIQGRRRPIPEDFSIPDTTRKQQIFFLREKGCTLASIGKVFHITRERVRQILNT